VPILLAMYMRGSASAFNSGVGKVLSYPGKLPPIRSDLDLEVHLLERVVGSEEELAIKPLFKGETLMLNSGTATTVGTVKGGKKDIFQLHLKLPICAKEGSRITIARRIGTRWRLIGYGIIK